MMVNAVMVRWEGEGHCLAGDAMCEDVVLRVVHCDGVLRGRGSDIFMKCEL